MNERIDHYCDGGGDHLLSVFWGPSTCYPDEWTPLDGWQAEINEYITLISYCPYCGKRLVTKEDA